ncbi:MAG TPA: YtxH domain-containing protein [Rhodoglobus sp.]|nr:YtxH domain-containing protein [Rhodoglobus sp.]
MRGKILLLVGLGVGYVLGTRAGREQYEKIKDNAQKLWNDPRVQQRVDDVQGFVKDKAPEVADFVTDNAKTVASKVSGRKPSGSPSTGSSGTGSSNSGTTSTGTTSSTSTTPKQ